MFTLVLLGFFAFLAGFVDSIAGGGGLIQLPALLYLRADLPIASILGTNKSVSIFGTSIATLQYGRKVSVPWKTLWPGCVAAFAGSFVGARLVSGLDSNWVRPFVALMLIVVGLYTVFRRDLGEQHAPRFGENGQRWAALLVGAAIGFYDGIFGPGTGTFLMFAFIGWLGFSFLVASGAAKAYNLASNLAAVLAFGWSGHIVWQVTLPMALCNIAGAFIGSRLAIRRGSQFVRRLFLLAVLAVIVKLVWDWSVVLAGK
ncbi:MAG TPA: TSUP family transporter [Anaerolineales bacterium]|nr:TSUP family transporter [Anaerolineales bacterium]